jgi:hypothetical protein
MTSAHLGGTVESTSVSQSHSRSQTRPTAGQARSASLPPGPPERSSEPHQSVSTSPSYPGRIFAKSGRRASGECRQGYTCDLDIPRLQMSSSGDKEPVEAQTSDPSRANGLVAADDQTRVPARQFVQ